jgi:hypothetical protein
MNSVTSPKKKVTPLAMNNIAKKEPKHPATNMFVIVAGTLILIQKNKTFPS